MIIVPAKSHRRLRLARRNRGPECHLVNSDRVHLCHRPGWPRARSKSRSPRWQRNRTVQPRCGLVGKRLQLLSEMVPNASRFSVIWTPTFKTNHFDLQEMQATAAELRLTLHPIEVTRPEDFDAAFRTAAETSQAVAVLSGPLVFTHRDLVVAAAARHKVPAM